MGASKAHFGPPFASPRRPHWRDSNRYQFADHLFRQNHLVIDGWIVLRFSYDDLVEKPRRCRQIVQQLFDRLSGAVSVKLSPLEKAVYDLARTMDSPITPILAGARLGVHRKTAGRHLKALKDKGLLTPLGKGFAKDRSLPGSGSGFQDSGLVVNLADPSSMHGQATSSL